MVAQSTATHATLDTRRPDRGLTVGRDQSAPGSRPQQAMTRPYDALALLGARLRAFKAIYTLSPQEIDAFFAAYALFDGDWTHPNGKHEGQIVDWYHVLNELCALGNVEKMYIPPYVDPGAGVRGNQIAFERRMMQDIGVRAGSEVLDIGCGRGRIAAHVSTHTGALVTGLNIDAGQVRSARENAARLEIADRCRFVVGSFNSPLPFPDASFDAVYQVQAFTYAKDKPRLFREVARVMRPGARFSFLDWVRLPAFDANDPKHRSLLARTQAMIGAVDTPSPKELCYAMREGGLEIVRSGDASIGGHQSRLIAAEDRYFNMAKRFIDGLVRFRVLPRHMALLFDRLVKDADAFIEMDKRGLATSSWQIVARKRA